MASFDCTGEASKANFAIFLSKNVQAYEEVAAECASMGLQCVLIASEDEGLEWLWARGRELQMVVLDEEFKLRVDDSFPATLARDWADVSVLKLCAWRQTVGLRSSSRQA